MERRCKGEQSYAAWISTGSRKAVAPRPARYGGLGLDLSRE